MYFFSLRIGARNNGVRNVEHGFTEKVTPRAPQKKQRLEKNY
jgi:hypothetical protein